MKIKTEKKIGAKSSVLIVPIFQSQLKKTPSAYPSIVKDLIKQSPNFKAKTGESVSTYPMKKDLPARLVMMGCGDASKFDAKSARDLGGHIGKYLKSQKLVDASLIVTSDTEQHLGELTQGIRLSQYTFDKFKKKNKKDSYELKKLSLIGAKKPKNLSETQAIADAIRYVQDLVNSPANAVDADYMAAEARKIAKKNRYKLASFGLKQLKKMGWGGVLGVNQGSEDEPRVAAIEYRGAKSSKEAPIVLVGKGVIFDTGGYSLKLGRSMGTMHQDMAGAATVLGVMSLLRTLGIKKNVIGIIGCTTNMISESAYKPSDIITMLSGHTVEITNTDAEGRLVLADCITYGAEFKPQAIITIATLTGAVAVATGFRYAGLMTNQPMLSNALQEAGTEVDDLAWQLPMHDDYRKRMDSDVADFKNCDVGNRDVGSAKAASFLEKFVQGYNWCHIDIGGTAFTSSPKPYQTQGATAHGLRMLIQYLQQA